MPEIETLKNNKRSVKKKLMKFLCTSRRLLKQKLLHLTLVHPVQYGELSGASYINYNYDKHFSSYDVFSKDKMFCNSHTVWCMANKH
ncbi:hypothetical protein M8J77_015052 [Diaphorina citri]|nr:hypothetical protein M8J77_015052 [Diaphorina citri]